MNMTLSIYLTGTFTVNTPDCWGMPKINVEENGDLDVGCELSSAMCIQPKHRTPNTRRMVERKVATSNTYKLDFV